MLSFTQINDAKKILYLYQSTIAKITQASLQTLLENNATTATHIMKNNQSIGFAITQTAYDQADMVAIAISANHQHQGFGTQLLTAHETTLKEKQVKEWFLEVRSSNKAAIGLYEKNKFETIGTRTAYYKNEDGSKENATLMRKILI